MTEGQIKSVVDRPLSRREYIVNVLLEYLPLKLVKIATPGLRCEPGVVVKTPGRLKLGRNVVLQRRALLHCGGKSWCNYKGAIELGEHVVVGPGCTLYGAGTIKVGDYTHFGPGSMIMSQAGVAEGQSRYSSTPERINEPVILGKGVWVGAGAVVLGGSVLGDGCTISPNSVVCGHYESCSTLIGNPARVALKRSNKGLPS